MTAKNPIHLNFDNLSNLVDQMQECQKVFDKRVFKSDGSLVIDSNTIVGELCTIKHVIGQGSGKNLYFVRFLYLVFIISYLFF